MVKDHLSSITHHSSPITRVGITGQSGFIGTHLFNTLGLYPEKFARIPFQDEYFQDVAKLNNFVTQCDAIIHLAAMNRHADPQVLYDTNITLVNQLIAAFEETNSKPHVLFASSIQEEMDNPYGRSKKEGRRLLQHWADRNKARFTGLIIPNVFGPFGHPYYNSVVATFCHQLTHNEQPKIDVDAELKLIYVAELVRIIIDHISSNQSLITSHQSPITSHKSPVTSVQSPVTNYQIPSTGTIKVSQLLEKLTAYKEIYFDKQIIPETRNSFDRNLFNTFVCYIDHKSFYPGMLQPHSDQRGSFVEVLKLNRAGGQVSFSTTVPGITRGDHFHTRKFERFAVIRGKARIDLRRIGTDEVLSFEMDGKAPSFVDMPIWYTHNITNVGDEALYTLFWISDFYDPNDPDTYFEKV
jgi:UDP-2-acetamido-2,6-beta-L-arabino-hexul-4-ose reductase